MLKILNNSLQPQTTIKTLTAVISEEINREYSFAFSAIIDGDKSQYIDTDNIAEVEDNYFNIVCTKEQRHPDGTIMVDAECEHVSYALSDNILDDGFTGYGTPAQLLAQLFQETIFTVGQVEFTQAITISINEAVTKRAVLLAVADQLGGELKFHKFEISLLTRRGADRGVQFRYRKNNISVARSVDKRKLVNGQPTVSYECAVAELEFVSGHGMNDHYELGDTVQVIDPGLNINTLQRIVKESHDPFSRMQGSVTIANFVPDISDSIITLQRTSLMKGSVYNGCHISPEDGFVAIKSDKTVRNTMNATVGNLLEVSDDSGNTWRPVFSVEVQDGKAILKLVGRQEVKDGNIILLESFKDTNGGRLAIYDNGGNLNVSVGVEGSGGANTGGTLILYNDSETKPRVALGINAATDSGVIEALDSNGKIRAYMSGQQSDGGAIFVAYDSAGNAKSYLSETAGKINDQYIATRDWVEAQGYTTESWVNSQGFLKSISGWSGYMTPDGTYVVSNGIITDKLI